MVVCGRAAELKGLGVQVNKNIRRAFTLCQAPFSFLIFRPHNKLGEKMGSLYVFCR